MFMLNFSLVPYIHLCWPCFFFIFYIPNSVTLYVSQIFCPIQASLEWNKVFLEPILSQSSTVCHWKKPRNGLSTSEGMGWGYVWVQWNQPVLSFDIFYAFYLALFSVGFWEHGKEEGSHHPILHLLGERSEGKSLGYTVMWWKTNSEFSCLTLTPLRTAHCLDAQWLLDQPWANSTHLSDYAP